jgi:hypothetical protein
MKYEYAVNTMFTRSQVERELTKHGATWSEFVADNTKVAKRDRIQGRIVLNWLGY